MKKTLALLLLVFGYAAHAQLPYLPENVQMPRPVAQALGLNTYGAQYASIAPIYIMVDQLTPNPSVCLSVNYSACFPTTVRLRAGDILSSTMTLSAVGALKLTNINSGNPLCAPSGTITVSGCNTTTIDGNFGAFTFTGPGVSHSGTTYTFSGTAGGVSSITGTAAATGSIIFAGPGVSQSGNTFTFTTGGGSVTTVTSGNATNLFTSTVNTPGTTPSIVYSLNSAPANSFFGNCTGSTSAPGYCQPSFANLTGAIASGQIPTATTSALGGVKVDGSSIIIDGSGVISAPGGGGSCGTGTSGYLMQWTGSTTCANSFFEYGITNAGAYTSSKDLFAPNFHWNDGTTVGGGQDWTEGSAPGTLSGHDRIYASAALHGPAMKNNGNGEQAVVGSTSYVALTDGAPITWAIGEVRLPNATVTLNHATSTRALNLTGLVSGTSGVLVIKQDATGGAVLTGGTGCTWKQAGGGGGAFSLTTAANAIDILAFSYDGTNCYVSMQKNFN